MNDTVKVSVNLPSEDVAALKELAAKRKTTVKEVLRRAIASEKFFEDETSQGGRVLIERGKKTREVVFK
jgi:predicted transcriptional regulator